MGGDWQASSLAEAGVALFDCDHRTPKQTNSGLPYVTIPQMQSGELNLSSARLISSADFAEWTKKTRPLAGDLVMSRRCNPGETAIVRRGQHFALGQNLVLLRADGRCVAPGYLRFLTRSPEWWAEVERYRNPGAVFDSLKCADVPKFHFLLPPVPEQERVADLLGALDDKIELNRRMAETLEATARALFKSWFVDFDPVHAKALGRPTGLPDDLAALFPDSFGENGLPQGWSECQLRRLLELSYGQALPREDRRAGSFPVYGSGGEIGWHDTALVSGPGIIIGRKGSVGSLYWVAGDFFPIDTVFFVKPAIGIPLDFLWYLLPLLNMSLMNTDAAVPGLNRENAYRIRCVAPNDALINAFAVRAETFRFRRDALAKETTTLAALRDALLPRLISGELRIGDAERVVAAA